MSVPDPAEDAAPTEDAAKRFASAVPDGIESDDGEERADLGLLYDPEVVAALDAWEPPEYMRDRPVPSRLATWSRTSLIGAAMTGFTLALQDIFENKKADAIVVEVDVDGEPHDLPIRLMLNPDDPSGSLCIVRRDPPPPVV